jgi:hypothetical protein
MAVGSDLFLVVAFLAALSVLFMVATALKRWVFELSPREWGYTVLLAFTFGVLLAGWFDGDGTLEFVSGLVIFLAFVWWVARLWRRRQVRQVRAAGG